MTIEELKKEYLSKIDALKAEFDDKIAELQRAEKRYKPEKGEKYYYISGNGTIFCELWGNDKIDKPYAKYYNVFKTKEEAEFAAERWKVMRELEMLADDDEEWDEENVHYTIKYNGKSLYVTKCWFDRIHPFFFKSIGSAQRAIDNIGEDRLKKYWLGIKEA